MSTLLKNLHAERRRNMSPEQRANLERLAIVIERFRLRNLRMARGLEIGFRSIERENGKAEAKS